VEECQPGGDGEDYDGGHCSPRPTVREALMAADPYGGVAMTNTKP
jgi:hypothetical protein